MGYGVENFLYLLHHAEYPLPGYAYQKGEGMEQSGTVLELVVSEPTHKQEVKKHRAAIKIQNNLTLLQRRAWNVLLHHAYYELLTSDEHNIAVRELCRALAFDSKNEKYLKDALRSLVHCVVEWNILGQDDKEEWGVAALLADAKIKEGTCTYSYGTSLRKRLYNPEVYAKLDLSLQNQFTSKYALALWELCTQELGGKRDYGESRFIPLDTFRKLMGIEEWEYASFKEVTRNVIKPAMTEVNRISDFHVSVEYQHKGRKVIALKFKIRRVALLPGAPGQQPELFPDLADMPAIVHRLIDAGLTVREALMIWNKGFDYVEPRQQPEAGVDFETYLTEKIALLHLRQEQSKVANASGFLLMAIRKNYSNAELTKRAAARERGRTMKELHALKAKRDTLLAEQDAVLRETCNRVIEAYPSVAENAITAMREEHDAAMRYYDATKSPVENYHARAAVQMAMGQWLERLLPEEFAQQRASFQHALEALEARMAALVAEGSKASA